MFLVIFAVLFVNCVSADNLIQPKFVVTAPNELVVKIHELPQQKLITFRIGVQKNGNDFEDIEHGENCIKDGFIVIYDERLKLQRGDVVNYLLAFTSDKGYQAHTGKYIFDGEYKKLPFNRIKREVESTTTELSLEAKNTGKVDVESRFGGGGFGFPGFGLNFGLGLGHRGPPPFVNRGPPRYPEYPMYPEPDYYPHRPHGRNHHRNHHHHHHHHYPNRYDRYNGNNNNNNNNNDRNHQQSNEDLSEEEGDHYWPDPEISTKHTTTSTEFPDIDIRFAED